MIDSIAVYPKQKLTAAEKAVDDNAYFKNTIKYYVQQCDTYGTDKYEMMTLYNLLGDEIDPLDYKHILNPFNFKSEEYQRMPAKLRNYNIIKPIIDLFLGERSERIDSFTVVTTENEENDYQSGWTQQVLGVLAQKVINMLEESGVDTGQMTEEPPELKKLKQDYDRDYGKVQSIFGQEALDYIIYDQDLDDKAQVMILDYLVTGRTYTKKEVRDNDVKYYNLSPLYSYHPELDLYEQVEDKEWFVYRHRWTPNQIVDKFRHELTDTEMTILDNVQSNGNFLSDSHTVWMSTEIDDGMTNNTGDSNATRRYYDAGKIDVWETYWKGWKSIQILTYQDQLGQLQQIEVTEDYVMIPELGDLDLETEWINCIYTGYYLDIPAVGQDAKDAVNNNETSQLDNCIFLELGEIPVDRTDLNNSSICKLPINGIVNGTRSGEILSFVKASMPYQMSTNIIMFQAEKFINKLKAKLTVIPASLFPTDHPDWTQEKFMWASEALDILVVDDSKHRAQASLNAIKSLTMGSERAIVELFDIARNLKMDYWESFGMNRQRYGDITQSAGKGISEQAVVRSSVITAEIYRRMNKLLEKDFEGLIDYSKLAWINGKKGNYVNSEGRIAFLQVNGDNIINHVNRDYRLFVKNSREEQEKMGFIKNQMLFAAAQNGFDLEVQFAMLNANNPAQAEKRVNEAMAVIRENQAAMAAKEEEIAKAQAALDNKKIDMEQYKADKEYAKEIDGIMLKYKLEGGETAANINVDFDKVAQGWGELDNKEKTRKDNKEIALKKIAADKEKARLDAATKKATASKNKTSNK